MRAVVLALLVLATPALAEPLPIKPGGNFLEARKMLIAKNWTGTTAPDPNRCGIGWEDICGSPTLGGEVYTCRGTGLAGCTFVYSQTNSGPMLAVETHGEEIEHQRVARVHIMTPREERQFYADTASK